MGRAKYELGGMGLRTARNQGEEWLAPESVGATLTLNKGDMLVIPRGTPHKRITDADVTLILISIGVRRTLRPGGDLIDAGSPGTLA